VLCDGYYFHSHSSSFIINNSKIVIASGIDCLLKANDKLSFITLDSKTINAADEYLKVARKLFASKEIKSN
jgi:hypothetical protein